jgi:hypothetical protein
VDRTGLVKVGGKYLLDPNDPKFLEKLLSLSSKRDFDIKDPKLLGKLVALYPYLKDTLTEQYAKLILAPTPVPSPAPLPVPVVKTAPKVKPVVPEDAVRQAKLEATMVRVLKWMLGVLVFMTLILLMSVFSIKYDTNSPLTNFVKSSNTSKVSVTEQKPIDPASLASWLADNIGFTSTPTSGEAKPLNVEVAALKTAVLRTALDNFHTQTGIYPTSAGILASNTPDNWLSFVPSGLNYIPDSFGYRVYPDGFDPNCLCKPRNLELAFFPESNQIALMQGKTALAVYPVASAKSGSELPFKESTISERVVNPNGGNGAYGKRGLALEQNFAIHGTRDESTVGKRVSHGCIRMTDKDIEELYPYVPLGTPFKVKVGKPDSPMYPKGLPSLGGGVDVPTESKPNSVYTWNW